MSRRSIPWTIPSTIYQTFRMLARISLSQQICHYVLVSDDCDVVGACSGFGAHILEREEVFGWKREAGGGTREALQTGRLYRTAD